MFTNRVETIAGDVAHRQHRHADRDSLHREHLLRQLGGEVRLREHDHRLGAAFPCEHEIALESSDAEVRVEPVQQKRRVDVGREHLRLRAAEHLLARERRAAWKDAVDRRAP